jgi:hypothetical protein
MARSLIVTFPPFLASNKRGGKGTTGENKLKKLKKIKKNKLI